MNLRTLNIVFFTAVAVSIVHYTDNYVNFEEFPQGGPGPQITDTTVLVAWFVFTAFGLAGYLLYRRGEIRPACALLAVYSISGLIGLGHYTSPDIGELAWWRNIHIVLDVLCGAAVLAFAIRAARSHASGSWEGTSTASGLSSANALSSRRDAR